MEPNKNIELIIKIFKITDVATRAEERNETVGEECKLLVEVVIIQRLSK